MASPQTENGYTKIANELLEAICRARLKATELSVVLWVARMSYGWHARKTKPLGLREMAKDMETPQSSVCLAVQVLIENRVLIRDEKGRFAINKDYDSWLNAAQPVGQKVPSPLGTLPSPLGTLPSPLGKTAQPVGQFHDEPKERKESTKESVKGNSDTNTVSFSHPSLTEIVDYAVEINKPMDCRKFFDHYEANGWMRGKNKIADWKAVLRLWDDEGRTAELMSKVPPLCRCGRTYHYKKVKSRDGKTTICEDCRENEDIVAGEK